ncbi:MAG: citramalate synthase [Spirochaetes bacterium]|jgi:2-isopropylmalate synthase|nr:citramalate synthase [Spirochaetota bacterium]
MNKQPVAIFDSTLRDGAQAEGISFSVKDKIDILQTLDSFGIAYIEAGNPGSNPKDLEFFEAADKIKLKNSTLAAFGSTRRRNIKVEDDANVQSLLKANTPAVVIFGKSWDFHVTEILKATLNENLEMITDTIAFFKEKGKEVIFDAEHFFDGYKNNAEYALSSLRAAVKGGADSICLCETNGGAFPDEVATIVKTVSEKFADIPIGIHTHNDSGMAVANSVIAVINGASQVQGTFIGFGERCGNANLSAIIPNLEIKRGYSCLPEGALTELTTTARKIATIANMQLPDFYPFVGNSAFAHKGGMHIDGVNKNSRTFEHIEPSLVGNERRFLVSEVAGRSMILSSIQKIDPSIGKDSEETKDIINILKSMEHEGYQFEGAESSFELVIHRHLKTYKPFFDLEHFKIIGEEPAHDRTACTNAIIKVKVGDTSEITAAEGDGPVNALDKALRKALDRFFPELKNVRLTDFKVRVLDTKNATAAKVRVLIESTDGENIWSTIGVSTDIIEASWKALVDSIEYKLLMKTFEN